MALSWPSGRDREALCLEDLGRRRVELKVWRRTEWGLQVEEEEEESVVFSNIEVRVKRAGPSGLGDLEVTDYIARIIIVFPVYTSGTRHDAHAYS